MRAVSFGLYTLWYIICMLLAGIFLVLTIMFPPSLLLCFLFLYLAHRRFLQVYYNSLRQIAEKKKVRLASSMEEPPDDMSLAYSDDEEDE